LDDLKEHDKESDRSGVSIIIEKLKILSVEDLDKSEIFDHRHDN
jgi:hypothetical protein